MQTEARQKVLDEIILSFSNINVTAKEILYILNTWAGNVEPDCVRDINEVKKLWAVFIALRGPDVYDYEKKFNSTAVIRAFTIPNIAVISGAIVNGDFVSLVKYVENDFRLNSNHFNEHIRAAYQKVLINPKSKSDKK